MGNNHSQHPVTSGNAARPLALHREQSSTVRSELVIENCALSRRNSTCSLDWERWQQEQFQKKPIRRTSSQRGYRPRSASLRRLRSIQRRRFLKSSPSKTTAKMEAEKSKLQEEIVLLAACTRGDLSLVEKLVDSGVDVNSSDQNQMTALHYAAMYTRDNVIKSLISRGAVVDTADLKEGFSAIHWVVANIVQKCSSTDLEKSLTALAKAGCSVNATDFNYATPLHIAAQKGNRDAMKVLLRLGADPNKVDITGRDCFEVAQNEQMKKYMKKMFDMPNDQLESKHIYHILEPPLPSIPAPLLTVNSPKLLCTRKLSHEQHIYQTLEFYSRTSYSSSLTTASATPPPLPPHKCCQHPQPTTEPHLYHVLEPIPTIKSRSYEPTSPPRKRKKPKC